MRWAGVIFRDGILTKKWKNIFSAIGIASAFGAWLFIDDLTDIRFWLLTIIVIVFGYGSAWAGLMEKWGFKPFTNDPLGWRKAKGSYKPTDAPAGEQKQDHLP